MLLEDISIAHRQVNDLLQLNVGDEIKTLVFYWIPKESFTYEINYEIFTDVPTKRKILSTIKRLVDPLRWLK